MLLSCKKAHFSPARGGSGPGRVDSVSTNAEEVRGTESSQEQDWSSDGRAVMQAKAPALRVNHCPVQSLLHAAQQAFQPPPRAHQYTRALKLPETAEKSAEPKGYLLQMALQLPEQQFELSTKGCCCSPRCEWWLWRLTEHRTGKKKQTNQNASVKLQTWLKVPVCGLSTGGLKPPKGKGLFLHCLQSLSL